MKDDLKRLLNEFREETINYRKVKKDLQFTDKMPEKFEIIVREPTMNDFLLWLNGEIGEEEWDYTNNRIRN